MNISLNHFGIACLVIAMASCGAVRPVIDKHPYSLLAAPIVDDSLPLSTGSDEMENLAFTFPVFDLGAVETRKNIRVGDMHVCVGQNFWQLAGDGGQTTITLERLTAPHVSPLVVRLSIGPVFDGVGARSPLHVYKFERTQKGWRRIEYNIVEQ
jgi:hypothetical protein